MMGQKSKKKGIPSQIKTTKPKVSAVAPKKRHTKASDKPIM